MICGAAKKIITPSDRLLENLHGLGNVTFSGVLDDIFVRAMILGDGQEQLLFVVFDLDKVPYPEKYLPALSELAQVPEENIMLASIHTHTAPVTGWRPNEGPNFILRKPEHVQMAIHEYEEFLEQAVYEVVREALSARKPAKIGFGFGKSYVNINRLQDYFVRREDGEIEICVGLGQNPEAAVDHSLHVLKAEGIDGCMIACLTNYAVHNCVMIGNRCGADGGTLLSSDLGGNVSRMIEENNPGCVALWTSGAAGDVNPVMMNEIFYPDPLTGAQTAYILPAGEQAPCMMLKVLAARHYADVMRVLNAINCCEEPADVSGAVEWAEMPGKGEQPYQIRVHLMKIGSLALWGISGELFSTIGKAITETLPDGTHLIVNHDASLMANTGYIYDDETLERDREGVLPGRKNNEILPGYAQDALLNVTAGLWARGNREREGM